jgi:hypothetical protein
MEKAGYFQKNPSMKRLYPSPDGILTKEKIHELGERFAKRLRLSGLIGLILIIIVFIFSFYSFKLISVGNLTKVVGDDIVLMAIIWGQRFVEKWAWPFRKPA